jgi:hypothetical protein
MIERPSRRDFSVPQMRVPHISPSFGEMWDGTNVRANLLIAPGGFQCEFLEFPNQRHQTSQEIRRNVVERSAVAPLLPMLFAGAKPARTTVAVALVEPGMKIEIDCVAWSPKN